MKVVVSGSFGDLRSIRYVINMLESRGYEVIFPTEKHFIDSKPCIEAHHEDKGETSDTIALRAKYMKLYFDKIRECDILWVANMKHGKEHLGIGTAMEIGFAYALGKRIYFVEEPTDANVLSMTLLLAE